MKTITKIASIILVSCLLSLVSGDAAYAAKLYFFPASDVLYEGESFMTEVRLDTEGETINAGKIGIKADKNIFQLEEFNHSGGIFTIYPEGPTLENGSIVFQAAVPNGYEGNSLIGRLFLRVRDNITTDRDMALGSVSFLSDSEIVLDDGQATPVELELTTGTYTVTERPDNLPIIISESHPSENEWRSGPFIRLDWEVKEGALYSYKLTRNPQEGLDDIPDEPVGDIKLTTSEDGIFYFLLKECMDGECGPVAKYRIFKDSTPPEPFEIRLGQDTEAYSGKKFLSFFTEDKTSGMSYYEVNETGEWKIVSSPYILENQNNKNNIQIRAVDRAGNERVAVYQPKKVINNLNPALIGIIIIGVLLLGFWLFRAKIRHK